ncbi:efflux RND transporter periplasmic adaptor subunit [Wenyingzhuangia sp. 2_MG-2023]|uniref:efflux RND transporter periplasmic adaptor subunit n=1 Tax=Wenyingzhuangia sp. 2_MG-2023 TaxID=3062639 RepID=UPI0026E15614|nr:efflux RND transporter periplasmic adaptor subunit [Wenyingzhuangia sp. 2_MG-2023]MDO6738498.1 efflux RND transporter periplasmic adaptor subunit [Wenyingzhuangia sp. 2_MG-2023]
MKKSKTILILSIIVIAFVLALGYLWRRDQKKPVVFNTKKASIQTVVLSTVASGKITPKEEVVIRPNIPGIIDEIYVEAGDTITAGDPIAKIKVIPTINNLQSSANSVSSAKIDLDTEQKIFDRQKLLFDKGVISINDFDKSKATYQQAKQRWISATENYEIIKTGTTKGFKNLANTLVRATVSGVVLQVPVEEGVQVIPSNNFNAGTELATIADVRKMIFKGTVDESEVGKIKEGMPITIKIGALPDLKFEAILDYISPKGVEENGAVQFDIEAAVKISKNTVVRSGLSANASIILDKAVDVLTINESLLQYDKETKKTYVEVLVDEQDFERKDVVLGISDGITVEVKEGITKEDKVKDWNAVVPQNKNKK